MSKPHVHEGLESYINLSPSAPPQIRYQPPTPDVDLKQVKKNILRDTGVDTEAVGLRHKAAKLLAEASALKEGSPDAAAKRRDAAQLLEQAASLEKSHNNGL